MNYINLLFVVNKLTLFYFECDPISCIWMCLNLFHLLLGDNGNLPWLLRWEVWKVMHLPMFVDFSFILISILLDW